MDHPRTDRLSTGSASAGTSTANSGLSNVSDLISRAWLLCNEEYGLAEDAAFFDGWTVSELLKQHLSACLDAHQLEKRHREAQSVPQSLVVIAAMRISQLLWNSEDQAADLMIIRRSLTPTILPRILREGRLPYVIIRKFLDLDLEVVCPDGETNAADLLDIDETVLAIDKEMRTHVTSEWTINGLVTLDGLVTVLRGASESTEETVRFTRKVPPLGGFECLDDKRARSIEVLTNNGAFKDLFHLNTAGLLSGLDWNNIFVTGSMILTTMMASPRINAADVNASAIDIHLYGLSVRQANAKIEEIYNVWVSNLPRSDEKKLVIKNPKIYCFLAAYPLPRVRIFLKLHSSPVDVLLQSVLDISAIGFDGDHVSMLPRCARAIETGYSIMTMDLIWGRQMNEQCATSGTDVFRWANRGYGLRILPSYIKSLEQFDFTIPSQNLGTEEDGTIGIELAGIQKRTHYQKNFDVVMGSYANHIEFRKPNGPEHGLRTLMRVAYLGKDCTHRLFYQMTPLSTRPQLSHDTDVFPHVWIEDYENRKIWFEQQKGQTPALKRIPYSYPETHPSDHNRNSHPTAWGRPLSGLEVFMRYCEAWRLGAYCPIESEQLDHFMYCHSKAESLELEALYDTRQYGSHANWQELMTAAIERDNEREFSLLKKAICRRLNIAYHHTGYKGYLTRRIRLQVYGADLESVYKKQITIPIAITHKAEDYITRSLPLLYPQYRFKKRLLIPVHNLLAQVPPISPLPSLQDVATEQGNLRFWVISNETMWAGQNPLMDEVSEAFGALQDLYKHDDDHHGTTPLSESSIFVARILRKRGILFDVPSKTAGGIERTTGSGMSKKEATLFHAWVLREPNSRSLTENDPTNDDVMLPVPDELFWKDGQEGNWNGEDVQVWTDVPSVGNDVKAEDKSGDIDARTSVSTKRKHQAVLSSLLNDV